jgi:hypothetical protein
MIDRARAWQRPIFSAGIIGCAITFAARMPADGILDAFRACLVAGGFLYVWRGFVDKGAAERLLGIWKGRNAESD